MTIRSLRPRLACAALSSLGVLFDRSQPRDGSATARRRRRRDTRLVIESLPRRELMTVNLPGFAPPPEVSGLSDPDKGALVVAAMASAPAVPAYAMFMGQAHTQTSTRTYGTPTSGSTITVTQTWWPGGNWSYAETVTGWYDRQTTTTTLASTSSSRSWGLFNSSYRASMSWGTMTHASTRSGTDNFSHQYTASWATATGTSNDTGMESWQAQGASSYTGSSAGSTRFGAMISFTGNDSRQGTSGFAWSRSGNYAYAIEGGTVSGGYAGQGGGSRQFASATSATLGVGGRIVTTGSGSESDSAKGMLGYNGQGTYSWNTSSGSDTETGVGAVSEYGVDTWNSGYTASYAYGPQGWALVSGSGGAGGFGNDHRSWTALGGSTGTIAGGSTSGSWNGSGRDDSSYQFGTSATVSAGTWTTIGIGSTASVGGTAASYQGVGSYASTTGTGGATASYQGALTASGAHSTSYSSSASYAYDDADGWVAVSGTGATNAGGNDRRGWSATGVYAAPLEGGNSSGTSQSSGVDDARYGFTTSATMSAGTWITIGAGTTDVQGGTQYAYQGVGSYASTTTTGDRTAAYQGGLNANGGHTTSYGYTVGHTYDDRTGWQATAGAGTSHAGGSDHLTWSATGTYTAPLEGGSVRGSSRSMGKNDATYAYGMTSSLVRGAWVTVGAGTMAGQGLATYDSVGTGAYETAIADAGGTDVSQGRMNADSKHLATYGYTVDHAYDDRAGWQATSGTARSGGSGSDRIDWSASGAYTRNLVGGSVSGTWRSGGLAEARYHYGTTSTLTGGEWTTVGSGATLGHGRSTFAYQAGGSYLASVGGILGSRVTVSGSGDHEAYYDYEAGQSYDDTHGWRVTSGAAAVGGQGRDQGNWSVAAPEMGSFYSRGSGGPQSSGSIEQSYSYGIRSSIIAPDVWRTIGAGTTVDRTATQSGANASSTQTTTDYAYDDAAGWRVLAQRTSSSSNTSGALQSGPGAGGQAGGGQSSGSGVTPQAIMDEVARNVRNLSKPPCYRHGNGMPAGSAPLGEPGERAFRGGMALHANGFLEKFFSLSAWIKSVTGDQTVANEKLVREYGTRVFNQRLTQFRSYFFGDLGNEWFVLVDEKDEVRGSTIAQRNAFLLNFALANNVPIDGKFHRVEVREWTDCYAFTQREPLGIWSISTPWTLAATGSYEVRIDHYPETGDEDRIPRLTVTVRNVNLRWLLKDEMDANDFEEYQWTGQGWGKFFAGFLEVPCDLFGDKLLGANFEFGIFFDQVEPRPLSKTIDAVPDFIDSYYNPHFPSGVMPL